MGSEIFVNVRPYQTRMALLNQGQLKNIAYYSHQSSSMMGSIYKGSVLRIDPILNFAFIDIGHKKACFLYGKDLADPSRQVENTLQNKQDILIQIKADPIHDKGSRCTTDISLTGFFIVYLPLSENKIVISKQITNEKERKRLKNIVHSFDAKGTVIIRTLSEGRDEEELKNDMTKLMTQWEDIQKKFDSSSAPQRLLKPENNSTEHLKDFLTENIDSIIVDDEEAYLTMREHFKISRVFQKKIKQYKKKKALFRNYDVEAQIEKALKKKIHLKGGGSLIFEELEAFTVIDVNTARYQGKKNIDQAILSVNLEAAQKIAEQIILRHLGGIILVDFIDMKDEAAKKDVVECLNQALMKDRLKSKVYPMANLGLVQITRKRKGLSLSQQLKTSCQNCKGEGMHIKDSVQAKHLLQDLESHSPRFKLPFFNKTKKIKVLCSPSLKVWLEEKEEESLKFLKDKYLLEAYFVEDSGLNPREFKIIKS